MPNPATPADVEARWRLLTDQEQTNATTFLGDAWRRVRRAVPDLEARLALGDEDLRADTVEVLATATLRVLKNIDGTKRESSDDYVWERDETAASGLLYVTADELATLRAVPVAAVGPAYIISLGG